MATSNYLTPYGAGVPITNNYYGAAAGSGGSATGAGGATDWGAILGQLLTGGYDIYSALAGGSQGDIGRAKESAAMADPFASQRPQYQQQLQQLMTDPNSFKQDPGYQFALSQGQQAISGASNALYGGTRAGALYPELAKYTEGYAAQNYDNRIQQLMQMAGVQSGSPGTAGALNAGGYQNQGQDLGSGTGNLLRSLFPQAGGGIGALISQLLGGGGSSGSIPSNFGGSPTGDSWYGGGNNSDLLGGVNIPDGSGPGGFGNVGMGNTWDSGNSGGGLDLGGNNAFDWTTFFNPGT